MPTVRYAGVGAETVYGTAVAAAQHVDIASATLDIPSDTELQHGGGIGRSASLHRPGFYAPTGNLVYAFDIHTIGWFLRWALGGYVYTAAPGTPPEVGLHLHEIYGNESNNLPSFTTRLGKDLFEHVFSGCVVNSLEIAVSDGWAQATIDIAAQKDAKAVIQPVEDLLLPDAYPLAFHEVTASVNGGDISSKVRSVTISIVNNVDVANGRRIGSRFPRAIPAGARDVTFSSELHFDDTTELERFWGGSSGPDAGGPTEFAMEYKFEAGADGELIIAMPRVAYIGSQQQPSGRDVLFQTVNGKAYADANTLEDASEINSEMLISLFNSIATMA